MRAERNHGPPGAPAFSLRLIPAYLFVSHVSYTQPIVQRFDHHAAGSGALSAKGGQQVTIVGSDLGSNPDLLEVRCTDGRGKTHDVHAPRNAIWGCTYRTLHSHLECTTIPGAVGSRITWSVVVAGVQSTSPSTSTHEPCVMHAAVEGHVSTMGGDLLRISGVELGIDDDALFVAYGDIAAINCTLVKPNLEVHCLTAPGVGAELKLQVRVADQVSVPRQLTSMGGDTECRTEYISYPAPSLDGVDPMLAPTAPSGTRMLTLSGRNFGPPEEPMWLSFGGAMVLVETHDHVTASASLPSAVGSNLPIYVLVGGQTSSDERTWSFEPPAIDAEQLVLLNEPAMENGRVHLGMSGRSFSGPSIAGDVRGDGLSASFRPGRPVVQLIRTDGVVETCEVTRYAHTSLDCWTFAEQGFLVVRVGGQSSSPPVLYRLEDVVRVPVIASARTDEPRSTEGGFEVTLLGSGFTRAANATFHGDLGREPRRFSRLGSSEDATTMWLRAPPGVGEGRIVVASNPEFPSIGFVFAYDAPVVVGVVPPSHAPTSGGTTVVLTGRNFGAPWLKSELAVKLGAFPCAVNSFNHSRIVCTTSQGEGAYLDVVVSDERFNIESAGAGEVNFSYAAPTVRWIGVPRPGMPTQGGLAWINGSNLGVGGSVRIGPAGEPGNSSQDMERCDVPREGWIESLTVRGVSAGSLTRRRAPKSHLTAPSCL